MGACEVDAIAGSEGIVLALPQGDAELGVVVATQYPMDLDFRILSNAGVWFVDRLQTDADRERVVDAMRGMPAQSEPSESAADGSTFEPALVTDTVKRLAPSSFVARNVHRAPGVCLLQTRTTLSRLRGPMTRADLKRLSGRPE